MFKTTGEEAMISIAPSIDLPEEGRDHARIGREQSPYRPDGGRRGLSGLRISAGAGTRGAARHSPRPVVADFAGPRADRWIADVQNARPQRPHAFGCEVSRRSGGAGYPAGLH